MSKKTYAILAGVIIFIAGFLRLFKITQVPPSLYWEEVALGYDAYSIAETLHDHHGNYLPIVAFESFGDYKPSLYFYAVVPFIKLFGLTELAVRLPAALSGVMIVWGMGALAKYLYLFSASKGESKRKKSLQRQFSLIAMLVGALSPWGIIFSKAGWEVNLATALILWGVVLFFRSLLKKTPSKYPFLGSVILFSLSMYAYHSARVIAPMLGISLAILALTKSHFNWRVFLLPGLLAFVLLSPILKSLSNPVINHRFAETSIFSSLEVIEQSNQAKALAGDTVLSKIMYHRYVLFGKEILINFFDHFRLDFLFINGDNNPRHSLQYFGQLYHFEIIFLCLGMYALFKKRYASRWFLLWWLVIGILPSALTKTTPHALRILPTLPVWLLLIASGIQFSLEQAKHFKKLLIGIILSLYLIEVSMFERFYLKIYPELYKNEWQFGYKERIAELENKRLKNPDEIITFDRSLGRPAMYYWFYTKTDPREVQAANDKVKKDQGEFLEFKNIRFE